MKCNIHTMFYNFMAKTYDAGMGFYFKDNESSPRNVVASLITEKDQNLLDVCAGTCHNSIAIAKKHKNLNITAIDNSPKMLDVASNTIKKYNISNIETNLMDATHLDFKDNFYDVVVISLVLHEVKEEIQQAILSEVHRVIKDNGRLIVVEWEPPKALVKKIKFSLIELIEPSSYKRLMKQDMNLYFKNVGFEIKEVISCDYTKVYILKKVINKFQGE